MNIKGKPTNRLMIVLRTQGCEYARKTGGCTVCGFINNAIEGITEQEIIDQLDYCLETIRLHEVEEVDLLTLGSFLNDNEVSADIRTALLHRIASLRDIKRVSVESRSEYVSIEKLKTCQALAGDKILEFAIGLESADDYIRNTIIRKGLSKQNFENTVKMVKEAGCDLLVYLLIKPPHLSEQKAIEDAVSSAKYVFEIAKKYDVDARVAFEPVFICRNTHLEQLYIQGEYRLVNLWSVVEVISRAHPYGNIFVGLSDEELSFDRMPHSCPKCYKTIVDGIEVFNRTQSVAELQRLDCECKQEYEYKLTRGLL